MDKIDLSGIAQATGFVPDDVLMASPLQILWFLLIVVLVIGYFVLDGMDLGAGTLYPFIAKNEKQKGLVRRAIGPIWDGNEVWLLTAGGALFAAFAPAYATSFSGFYLAIMLVLFGLIARAVSLELRALDFGWKKLWDIAFFLGSAVPALLFGVAVGNIIQGVPLDAMGDYAAVSLLGVPALDRLITLLRIFPLCCGLVGLCVMLIQGASWIALKAPAGSEIHGRAVKLRKTLMLACVVLFVLATVTFFAPTLDPHNAATGMGAGFLFAGGTILPGLQGILQIVFAVIVVVGAVAALFFMNKKDDLFSFLATNLVPVGLVGLAAATLFPNFIPSLGPGASISLASGGSDLALTAMTIITCIGLPLVLAYHVIIYRTFRGRLKDTDLEEY